MCIGLKHKQASMESCRTQAGKVFCHEELAPDTKLAK
jgi:hypothetical protein